MYKNPKRITLIISFLIILVLDVIVTVHVSRNLLDNDTSGEMLLSKCLYDEKSLICSDWDYATEIRLTNQLVFAPLFGVFSDWTTIRIAGTLIIQALLLASFVFLMKGVSLHTESILFGSSLLLLPYCVAYGRITLYHSYYALYIAQAFFITGLFLRIRNNQKGAQGLQILLFLLCFIGCLQGLRIAYVSVIPLCILAFRFFLRREKENRQIFRLAFFCGLAGAFGLLLYALVISKLFRLGTQYNFRLSFKGKSEIFVVLFSILRQFGYRSGIGKGSFLGLMSFAGIGTAVYAVFLSGKAFLCEKDSRRYFLKAMLFVQLVMNFIIFLFFDLPYNTRFDYARYLVPASVWIIPLFCAVYEEQKNRINVICFYTFSAVFMINGLINLCFFHNPKHFSQEYDGLTFMDTKSISRYEPSVRFIRSEGFELGYAFSDSNSLSEYMDGFPIIGLSVEDGKVTYFNWLQRASCRDLRAEKVFLIAGINEAKTFRGSTSRDLSELVYNQDDRFLIFRINDPEAFKDFLGN